MQIDDENCFDQVQRTQNALEYLPQKERKVYKMAKGVGYFGRKGLFSGQHFHGQICGRVSRKWRIDDMDCDMP